MSNAKKIIVLLEINIWLYIQDVTENCRGIN